MILGGTLQRLYESRDNGESETHLVVILRKIVLCRDAGEESLESEIVLLK